MNKLRAKIAEQIVQKQSVHFLCLSSTGKFLNVYALCLNILINQDPNNFYLFKLSILTLPSSFYLPLFQSFHFTILSYNNFNYIDEASQNLVRRGSH